MLAHGFDVYPVSDGEIHRFKGPEDKKANGWYVCHGDHGAFGNWKSNLTVPWCSKDAQIDQREYQKIVKRERAERLHTESIKHADAATKAREVLAKSVPATEHPYLKRKQVKPHGIRVHGDQLVVPMTVDTHIHSLQFIHPDGFKKFMTGGRVKGCYFPIGSLTHQVWIAEGFATAATVHEVTDAATVCAFNASNLAAVTKHFVDMGLQVFIAADNDKAGWKAAGKARLAGAEYRAAPDFREGQEGTDWNDFHILNGKDRTREGLYGA